MAYDRTNGIFVRTGYVVAQASGAPSASGQVSLWNQSGTLQVQTQLSGALTLGDPLTRLGYAFTDTVTAPVSSGAAALWRNSGYVQVRTPQAADIVLGNLFYSHPVVLSQAVSGATVLRFSPDQACRVIALDYAGAQAPGTSGSATFQLQIQGTSASGGVVTAVAANSAVGQRTAGTAVTGANSVGTSGEITVQVTGALSGSFGAGQGLLVVKLGPPA